MDALETRLELDRKYFTRREYDAMRRGLAAARGKPLMDQKQLLHDIRERLDARKRKMLSGLPAPEVIAAPGTRAPEPQIALLGSIIVDERIWEEMGLHGNN